MFMQTIAAAFTATFVGLHSAGAQSSSVQSPPSAHIVQMVNLVTTVDKTVDTKKARAGDPFTARVATAGKLDDSTDVPAGSILEGHVDSVTPSENKGDSVLTVTIDKLAIKNGKEVPVKATITRVDSTSPDSGDDKGYSEPSAYRVTSIPSTKPARPTAATPWTKRRRVSVELSSVLGVCISPFIEPFGSARSFLSS